MRADRFVPGRTYRRSELHDQFGGNRQKGISSPARADFAMLFTGRGHEFGYPDEEIDTDTFDYSGEGLIGDMSFTAGNQAIIDRSPNLHLFETLGGGIVKYVGLFKHASHRFVTGKGTDHQDRKVILFRLERVVED